MNNNSNIIVQKFGGSSLISNEFRKKVIEHIMFQVSSNKKLVIVVSAMGRLGDPYSTDTLINYIEKNGNYLNAREMDLLLSCGEIISATTLSSMLNELQVKNIVLTGGQAGIVTDKNFSNAKIKSINPKRITVELDNGNIVIVAGFQGISEEGDITTLGRGGSDTTATALGVALQAEVVDIFTDVEGIMSADPRIVAEAEQLLAVTYDEICNLTNQGAKVIHPRAVEIAKEKEIPIRVRSTFSRNKGTLVISKENLSKYKQKSKINDKIITGITQVPNIAQIKLSIKENQHNTQLQVFKTMAENQINVDFINSSQEDVTFTVNQIALEEAIKVLKLQGYNPVIREKCAKVSIVGAGMAGVPGIMAYIIESLAAINVEILQSVDSHTTIWVLVKEEDMDKAIRALHNKFYKI